MIIWFTGQAGSGKTTLAKKLETILRDEGKLVFNIDGDELRDVYQNFDYSETGRRKNVEIAATAALLLANKGFVVIVSLISPFRDQRDYVKSKHQTLEIYCDALDAQRKEKYKSFSMYEAPEKDFLYLNTRDNNIEECLKMILNTVN
jgi:adenylylsulfate kinase